LAEDAGKRLPWTHITGDIAMSEPIDLEVFTDYV